MEVQGFRQVIIIAGENLGFKCPGCFIEIRTTVYLHSCVVNPFLFVVDSVIFSNLCHN